MAAAAPVTRDNTVLVTFTVIDDWGAAFQAQISITNNADYTIWEWVLGFEFPHSIDSLWDAEIRLHEGDCYEITALQEEWADPNIAPGATVAFSFVAAPGGAVTPPYNGALNGAPVAFNAESPAPPPLEPLPPPPWPLRVFAPYVDATGWPPFDFTAAGSEGGITFFRLGFIVADPLAACAPSWGGYYNPDDGYLLQQINAIRGAGGDVAVSFGGAAGTELAASCSDAESLRAAYQRVIDAYELSHIDFDIEGIWTADPVSIARRSQAIYLLQLAAAEEGRELRVTFTLPVLPSGLTADGLSVLQSALAHSVTIDTVNIMAMDYGSSAAPDPDGQMGEYAILAAENLFAQLQTLYETAGIPRTSEEIYQMIGITPMIGRNDVLEEVFYQEDAGEVLAFAVGHGCGLLSFWSANRDVECPEGEVGYVSPNCSSILQLPWDFSLIFAPFTGGQPATPTPGPSATATPNPSATPSASPTATAAPETSTPAPSPSATGTPATGPTATATRPPATATATATATPTASPVVTTGPDSPTHTPRPTETAPIPPTATWSPTPAAGTLGLKLSLNQGLFRPDDRFVLTVRGTNPGPPCTAVQCIVLDVYGEYYFWPAWDRSLGGDRRQVPQGYEQTETILDFIWPASAGTASDIRFWAAFLDPQQESILGEYDMLAFSYTEA